MPKRRRRIPPQFSWVDQRLVRDGHIRGRSPQALALYLVLVTVADADGLSWYSEAALRRLLSWTATQLRDARTELREGDLIAYRRPLYQVLDLCPLSRLSSGRDVVHGPSGQAVSVGEILQGLLKGGPQ